MQFDDTPVPGLKTFIPQIVLDGRGDFTKLVHAPSFSAAGLPSFFPEHYISTSRRGVIRGMHFQTPPHEHDKLVVCLAGQILDVVLDLRATGGGQEKAFARELNGDRYEGLFIPRGCAHGFQALTDGVVLAYYVTTVYSPEHDSGVRFDSFGFDWPIANPIVSPRDRTFPGRSDFPRLF